MVNPYSSQDCSSMNVLPSRSSALLANSINAISRFARETAKTLRWLCCNAKVSGTVMQRRRGDPTYGGEMV